MTTNAVVTRNGRYKIGHYGWGVMTRVFAFIVHVPQLSLVEASSSQPWTSVRCGRHESRELKHPADRAKYAKAH